jgi:hypothetical protein
VQPACAWKQVDTCVTPVHNCQQFAVCVKEGVRPAAMSVKYFVGCFVFCRQTPPSTCLHELVCTDLHHLILLQAPRHCCLGSALPLARLIIRGLPNGTGFVRIRVTLTIVVARD